MMDYVSDYVRTPAGWIPRHLFAGLRRYIYDRIRPGHLMCAVLRDELGAALASAAPDITIHHLKNLHGFLMAHVPGPAWGSAQALDEWLSETDAGSLQRLSRFQDLPNGWEKKLEEIPD